MKKPSRILAVIAPVLLLCVMVSGELRVAGAGDPLRAAVESNSRLSTVMSWQFGGKTQRGWSLYTPLIGSLIELNGEWDERLFAFSLLQWQKRQGLAASGVLDGETWSRMIATWQNRRIRERTYPSASQLVTASVSDLYDPERPLELRRLDSSTYSAYRRMVAAAAAELRLSPSDRFLKIISAFRSREYQEQLRRQSPHSGRAGLAINSPHFTGRALDLYVGGEPVSTRDDNRALQTQTPVYRWLVKNAARFGFQPYFYEPWHWEYCAME